MAKNEIILKPTYWASVSGGKDSLYVNAYSFRFKTLSA